MTINKLIANSYDFGSIRNLDKIKYIVIHYTGNDGDTAKGNCNYFHNTLVKASAHYFVDDTSIWQSVEDNRVAYSVGAASYKHPYCRNTNSISVEICDCKRNGIYDFTEATLKNAAELVKSLMKKYNVPIGNVIRHYDVTGKLCPRPFINENNWKAFKDRLVEPTEIKYTINQRVLFNIPVGIAFAGEKCIVDSNGYQFWIHSSVIKDNNRIYGLGDVLEVLGNDLYKVKIFEDKFLCRPQYMSDKF